MLHLGVAVLQDGSEAITRKEVPERPRATWRRPVIGSAFEPAAVAAHPELVAHFVLRRGNPLKVNLTFFLWVRWS